VITVPDIIETEFQEIDIPGQKINMWPNGWAVAHRKTAFWATGGTRIADITLLGQPVRIRATPVQYRWDFGDGAKETRRTPGARPRSLDRAKFTHEYRAVQKVRVSLTTIYHGEYSVSGGPMTPIAGDVGVTTQTDPIQIYRFHKYLVSGPCADDPTDPDCIPSKK
jgi:hypothetical protein